MNNNAHQPSYIFSRRQTLLFLRAIGTTALVACTPKLTNGSIAPIITQKTSTPGILNCTIKPEQTEGPYFVDEKLNRSDIRIEPSNNSVSEGIPLSLKLRISSVSDGQCNPLAGAIVDIWHCDAMGVYSDVQDNNEGFDTSNKKFLRGYQVTNSEGIVQFSTIYPGYYPGRTPHIHVKVRSPQQSSQNYEFTSQLYFDDSISDEVYKRKPYNTRKQSNFVRNNEDGIFLQGGKELILPLVKSGQGYASTFNIGIRIA